MIGDGCAVTRQNLAVYLFGALAPAERAEVDGHLVSCRRCQDELVLLAGLPALLQRVPAAQAARICDGEDPAEALDHVTADGPLTRMLGRTAQVRRHQRWRRCAAAVVLAAVAAVGWAPRVMHQASQSVSGGCWLAATAAGFDLEAKAGAWVWSAAQGYPPARRESARSAPAGIQAVCVRLVRC
jgi:hypothetical protein